MEGGYGNRGSSFSQSRRGRGRGRGRGHRFPSNQSKVSSFAERGTPSSSNGNRASASVISNTQEDDAQPSSNFVGTCPYMCPGKHFFVFFGLNLPIDQDKEILLIRSSAPAER